MGTARRMSMSIATPVPAAPRPVSWSRDPRLPSMLPRLKPPACSHAARAAFSHQDASVSLHGTHAWRSGFRILQLKIESTQGTYYHQKDSVSLHGKNGWALRFRV